MRTVVRTWPAQLAVFHRRAALCGYVCPMAAEAYSTHLRATLGVHTAKLSSPGPLVRYAGGSPRMKHGIAARANELGR
jgi:hypothetical protein